METKTKREIWEERVQRFQDSGLSRRAWCLEHDIPEHQMGYWVRKLRPEPSVEPNGQRWVGLGASSLNGTGVSIQVGDVTLTVKHGFNHQVLVDVVRALMTVC